jgi:hypothetical protein
MSTAEPAHLLVALEGRLEPLLRVGPAESAMRPSCGFPPLPQQTQGRRSLGSHSGRSDESMLSIPPAVVESKEKAMEGGLLREGLLSLRGLPNRRRLELRQRGDPREAHRERREESKMRDWNPRWAAAHVLLILFAFGLMPLRSMAETEDVVRPLQLSLFAPIQLFSEETSIAGLRLGVFYTRNENMTGLDVGGLFSQTLGDMTGLQIGGANMTEGEVDGVQVGVVSSAGDARGVQLGAVNLALGDVRGVGLGLVNFVHEDFTGWQTGLVNAADGEVRAFQVGLTNQMGDATGVQIGVAGEAEKLVGLQLGGFNHVGEGSGLQLGAFNVAEEIDGGVQLGVINVTREMKGLQIGLINVIEKGGWVMVLPLVNGSFD